VPSPDRVQITEQYVIVGEGAGDAAFFSHLCATHHIGGFQSLDAGGESKFEQYIKDLRTMTGFKRNCKLLLVVGDNDDEPDKNFKRVRRSVQRARVPVPDKPLEVIKWTNDDLRVAIMMMPFDNDRKSIRGCLETLLLESAKAKHPAVAGCVAPFETCVGANTWANGSHIDKFRLRAILASVFQDDPNFGLQYALDPKYDAIPLNHDAFSGIVNYLTALPGQMGRSVSK
jgi:uncharacterized protein DUF3226